MIIDLSYLEPSHCIFFELDRDAYELDDAMLNERLQQKLRTFINKQSGCRIKPSYSTEKSLGESIDKIVEHRTTNTEIIKDKISVILNQNS